MGDDGMLYPSIWHHSQQYQVVVSNIVGAFTPARENRPENQLGH